MKMLKESAPDYPKEAIAQILKNLVNKGNEGQRKAKEIVDKYIQHGNDTAVTIFGEIKDNQKDHKTPK